MYARLRIAVGLLGGASDAGWWGGRALDPVGQAVLARLFPTAPLLAALGAATAAAAHVHDDRIGRSGVYHLFRLPAAAEAALAAALADVGSETLRPTARNADAARSALAALAVPHGPAAAHAGPRALGAVDLLARPGTPASLAALYLAALDAGQPVYPYVTAGA